MNLFFYCFNLRHWKQKRLCWGEQTWVHLWAGCRTQERAPSLTVTDKLFLHTKYTSHTFPHWSFLSNKIFHSTYFICTIFFPQNKQRQCLTQPEENLDVYFSWCQPMLPALATLAHTFSFPLMRSLVHIAQPSACWRCLALTSTVTAICFASICGPSWYKCCTHFLEFIRRSQADQNPPQLHSALSAHGAVSFGSCSYLAELAHSFHTRKFLSTDCIMLFWKLGSIFP